MKDPLISVVVPVYKVEPYLDQCVASIVNQTYQNLEIILVDDGSPDNCPAMCDAWAEKDNRIKVLHKPNGGLSDARNAGMVIATGKYIGFIDSDDYVAPEMYRLLADRMSEDCSDIAACGVEMFFEDGTPSRMLTKSGSCVLNTIEALQATIEESWLKQPVWYKLYRSELIRSIPFPVGKLHEDVFWSYQAVACANCVSVIDTPCYYYRQRTGSIMGKGYSLKRLDAVEAKLQRLFFLQERFPSLIAPAQTDLLFSCMYHGQLALKHLKNPEKKQALAFLKKTVKQFPIPRNKAKSFVQKCWISLARWNLCLACRTRNLLGIGL